MCQDQESFTFGTAVKTDPSVYDFHWESLHRSGCTYPPFGLTREQELNFIESPVNVGVGERTSELQQMGHQTWQQFCFFD